MAVKFEMKLKEKNKYKMAIILLTIALVLFISNKFWNTTPIYKTIKIPEAKLAIFIQHWNNLPVIQKKIPANFWDKKVILIFVFNMSDCGICLPRVDKLISYADSLKNFINFGMLCIGISKNKKSLERYLLVAKKPCTVIYEDLSEIKFDYGRTPQVMIIDNRKKLKILKAFLPETNLKKIYFTELKRLLDS